MCSNAQTVHSCAKLAVKGFTEELRAGLRPEAPHVNALQVMSRHAGAFRGTDSGKFLGTPWMEGMSEGDLAALRAQCERQAAAVAALTHGYSDLTPSGAGEGQVYEEAILRMAVDSGVSNDSSRSVWDNSVPEIMLASPRNGLRIPRGRNRR